MVAELGTCARPDCAERFGYGVAGTLRLELAGETRDYCCHQCLDWALHYDPEFLALFGGRTHPPAQHAQMQDDTRDLTPEQGGPDAQ